jgi:hypothetical protein
MIPPLATRSVALSLILLVLIATSVAAESLSDRPAGVAVLAGPLVTGTFPGLTLIPFGSPRDGNAVAGAVFDYRLARVGGGFEIGIEAGFAARFGQAFSAEVWGGTVLRHRGMHLGPIQFAPAFVTGFSAVTSAMGIEAARERSMGGDATYLFYLGPEIALSHERLPGWEFVYRVHHRSGGYGALGLLHEGANANLFGVRHRF